MKYDKRFYTFEDAIRIVLYGSDEEKKTLLANKVFYLYLGVTVDFDKENNAKCDDYECEIDIDEVQEYIIKFSLRLFI